VHLVFIGATVAGSAAVGGALLWRLRSRESIDTELAGERCSVVGHKRTSVEWINGQSFSVCERCSEPIRRSSDGRWQVY
jgi:hypothetical protein